MTHRALEDAAHGRTGMSSHHANQPTEEGIFEKLRAADYFGISADMTKPFAEALAACFVGCLEPANA